MVDSNRLTERNPKVRVFHSHPAGDPIECHFKLPKGVSPGAVEKAFLDFGQRWIAWRARQGWICNDRTIRMAGPYPCAELDSLDLDTYVISARFRREVPLLVSLDEGESFVSTEVIDRGDNNILTQLTRAPGALEANARGADEARRRLDEVRASWAQMDEDRRRLGLPTYKPEEHIGL